MTSLLPLRVLGYLFLDKAFPWRVNDAVCVFSLPYRFSMRPSFWKCSLQYFFFRADATRWRLSVLILQMMNFLCQWLWADCWHSSFLQLLKRHFFCFFVLFAFIRSFCIVCFILITSSIAQTSKYSDFGCRVSSLLCVSVENGKRWIIFFEDGWRGLREPSENAIFFSTRMVGVDLLLTWNPCFLSFVVHVKGCKIGAALPRSSMGLLAQSNKNLISSIPYLPSRFGHRIFERLATLLHERIRSSPIYTCSCPAPQCDSAQNGQNKGSCQTPMCPRTIAPSLWLSCQRGNRFPGWCFFCRSLSLFFVWYLFFRLTLSLFSNNFKSKVLDR